MVNFPIRKCRGFGEPGILTDSVRKSASIWIDNLYQLYERCQDIFPQTPSFRPVIIPTRKHNQSKAGNDDLKRSHGADMLKSDIQRECPGISRVMIKKIFAQMQKNKKIK